MALRDYKCSKCGKVIEVIEKSGDKKPECCGKEMDKQMSQCTFHLKGGGWFGR